jgi:hypothetical protein
VGKVKRSATSFQGNNVARKTEFALVVVADTFFLFFFFVSELSFEPQCTLLSFSMVVKLKAHWRTQ